jgi:hypothetical protein
MKYLTMCLTAAVAFGTSAAFAQEYAPEAQPDARLQDRDARFDDRAGQVQQYGGQWWYQTRDGRWLIHHQGQWTEFHPQLLGMPARAPAVGYRAPAYRTQVYRPFVTDPRVGVYDPRVDARFDPRFGGWQGGQFGQFGAFDQFGRFSPGAAIGQQLGGQIGGPAGAGIGAAIGGQWW